MRKAAQAAAGLATSKRGEEVEESAVMDLLTIPFLLLRCPNMKMKFINWVREEHTRASRLAELDPPFLLKMFLR
jgi:hypothetical protein